MADITKRSVHTLAEIDEAVDIALSGGGGSETPLVLRSAVMPMLDPTPSDQKIIDHAESEEI